MQRIGLRELRQHASRYVALVAEGASVEIAVRGRPVARMVPIAGDTWEDMIGRGEVVPAPSGADLLDEAPGDYRIDVAAELLRMRSEDDR